MLILRPQEATGRTRLLGTKLLTWKPKVCKSVPEMPAPSTARSSSYEAAKDKGPRVSPGSTQTEQVAFGLWTSEDVDLRDNPAAVGMLRRCGGSGAQVPSSSSAPAGGRARHSRSCAANTLARRRPSPGEGNVLQQRTRCSGRVSLFSSPALSITPGEGKARAGCLHPPSSAVTLKFQ